MGRSLKKRTTLKIGEWVLVDHSGSWKVKGERAQFSLRLEKTGKWKLSYQTMRDCGKKQKRARFQADDLVEALGMVERFLFGERSEQGGLTPPEMLARWVETLSVKATTLTDYDHYNRVFLNWIQGEGIQRWKGLRLEHLQAYTKSLSEEGFAWDTVRLYTYPLRAASRWASLNWPGDYIHFAEGFRLPRRSGRSTFQPLRITEVVEFLVFLEKDQAGKGLLAGVALQCLCGLRVTEVMRLAWEQVDLEAGFVTVDGEVKNEASRRTLPIPGLVVRILSEVPRSGDRVLGHFASRDYWYRAIKSALKRWNPDRVMPPKVFRKTLATEMRIRRWNRDLFDLYYGHAKNDVLSAHYVHETSSDRMQLFREEVVARVEEVLVDCVPMGAASEAKVVPLRAVR